MRNPKDKDLYPGRLVHYSGTVYRVESINNGQVNLVVPGQQYTMIYSPYLAGTYTAFSRCQVPVNSPFLWIDDQVPRPDVITTNWQVGDRLLVESRNVEGEVIHVYQACGKAWVRILTSTGRKLELFDSDNLQRLEILQRLEAA